MHLDVEPGGGIAGGQDSLPFGMPFDAEAAVRYGLALRVADDPVADALDLAAGPASAPREVSWLRRRPCARPASLVSWTLPSTM